MTTQQPDALDLADWLEAVGGGPSAKRCAALLREQHARITELESQLAQRFDAADMATAAAQSFRDGAASVSAGSAPVPNNRRSLEAVFRGLSDRAYCNYIEQMRRDACLGWEHKAAHGKFGEAELRGHTIAGEMLGRHKAFAEAANALRAPHGQAPATQQAREVSDAMVLAALQMQHPAAYGQYLRHPANGPKTSIRTEAEIDTARRMIAAALAAAPQPSPTAQAADSVQEDAARLDFLIDQRAYVVSDPDACPGHWLHWARPDGSTWVQGDEHPTPRAAIDAAIKQGEKQ